MRSRPRDSRSFALLLKHQLALAISLSLVVAGMGDASAALPSSFLFLLLLLLSCLFCSPLVQADPTQVLPAEEISALRQIDSKLKIGWNFSLNPCSGIGRWNLSISAPAIVSKLTCGECDIVTNLCHVSSIQLKRQNLTGVLPPDFANLTYLKELDLALNYINGTFPVAWASLPLVNLSLMGNRLTGCIPDEIGSITSLEYLDVENNLFEGPLPRSLGNLINLNALHLSANNFAGNLPETLGHLKNLKDLMIDATSISGKFPNFIGNWTKLTRLTLQGTNIEGPFPPTFSTLKNLSELRVANMERGGSFPLLEGLNLRYLTLRNCSLSGSLPDYVGEMNNLRYLDLSFNSFISEIPKAYEKLTLNYLYLTNNMLNGTIPDWLLRTTQNIDLSFNSFGEASAPTVCQVGNINLFSSSSTSQSTVIAPCLRKNYPCSGKAKNYMLFINCGGKELYVGEHKYEDDSSAFGPSASFISGNQTWVYSSTGDFMYGNSKYTAKNVTMLNITDDLDLYTSARLSPLSLRYYGICLQNGIYNVKLHFAEIIFTNDQTFSSVGRRLFDISIQGKKVRRNFNIADEAKGVGRSVILNFNASVEDNTLEIHFQWAGKGTTAVPDRSSYGPLVSAISVTPNFVPDLGENTNGSRKLSAGAIVGIIAASIAVTVLLFIVFYMRRNIENNELAGLELQTGYFSLRQIKSATRNFDPANKLGEGGFGSVYKGVLPDGSVIAVKQLSSKSRQGNREFLNEIGVISALQHPNLVRLFGCCVEGNQLLLVYEYMENNSLYNALFGKEGNRLELNWLTRQKICLGVARGLAYMHEESSLKIIHRDIKATNILLDKDLNAKISDFGLAKLREDENTHMTTRIAGTVGYMAPEYAMRGYLTYKADVYSFGVVMLEILSGKSNSGYIITEEPIHLLDWAYILKERGDLLQLVDPALGDNYPKEEALALLSLAVTCANASAVGRPAMSTVVSMLEGQIPMDAQSAMQPDPPVEKLAADSMYNAHWKALSMENPFLSSASTFSEEDGRPLTSTSVSTSTDDNTRSSVKKKTHF